MNNFDLKNFLVENKLTFNSKKISLLKEQEGIKFDIFDDLRDYWGEYPGTENLPSEDNGGEILADKKDLPLIKTIPTSDEWLGGGGGPENISFYDMGDRYILSVDDYLGAGAIYRKDELIRAIPALGTEEDPKGSQIMENENMLLEKLLSDITNIPDGIIYILEDDNLSDADKVVAIAEDIIDNMKQYLVGY
jgi:hypothetical protein